jgi:hypothetical protein
MIAHPLILVASLAVLVALQAWARWPGWAERDRRRHGPLSDETVRQLEHYYLDGRL